MPQESLRRQPRPAPEACPPLFSLWPYRNCKVVVPAGRSGSRPTRVALAERSSSNERRSSVAGEYDGAHASQKIRRVVIASEHKADCESATSPPLKPYDAPRLPRTLDLPCELREDVTPLTKTAPNLPRTGSAPIQPRSTTPTPYASFNTQTPSPLGLQPQDLQLFHQRTATPPPYPRQAGTPTPRSSWSEVMACASGGTAGGIADRPPPQGARPKGPDPEPAAPLGGSVDWAFLKALRGLCARADDRRALLRFLRDKNFTRPPGDELGPRGGEDGGRGFEAPTINSSRKVLGGLAGEVPFARNPLLNGAILAEIAAHCAADGPPGDSRARRRSLSAGGDPGGRRSSGGGRAGSSRRGLACLAAPAPQTSLTSRGLYAEAFQLLATQHAARPDLCPLAFPSRATFGFAADQILAGDFDLAWGLLLFALRLHPSDAVRHVTCVKRAGSPFACYPMEHTQALEASIASFFKHHPDLTAPTDPPTPSPSPSSGLRAGGSFLADPEVGALVRNGILLCRLAVLVTGGEVYGVHRRPKTAKTCLTNVVKGLEHLMLHAPCSKVYTSCEATPEAVYEGDPAAVLPLFEDAIRAYDKKPARQAFIRPGDTPYLWAPQGLGQFARPLPFDVLFSPASSAQSSCQPQRSSSIPKPAGGTARRTHQTTPGRTVKKLASSSFSESSDVFERPTRTQRSRSSSLGMAGGRKVDRSPRSGVPGRMPAAHHKAARPLPASDAMFRPQSSSRSNSSRLDTGPAPSGSHGRPPEPSPALRTSSPRIVVGKAADPTFGASRQSTQQQPPVPAPVPHSVQSPARGDNTHLHALSAWVHSLTGTSVALHANPIMDFSDGTLLVAMLLKLDRRCNPPPGIVSGATKTAQKRHNLKKSLEIFDERMSIVTALHTCVAELVEGLLGGQPATVVRVLAALQKAYGKKQPTAPRGGGGGGGKNAASNASHRQEALAHATADFLNGYATPQRADEHPSPLTDSHPHRRYGAWGEQRAPAS
ncbi:hypothetical protein DIPPA_16292 [Diplonema papillatum]|nr:hypothetical protein DIPPA_16292 [Diplonema papillatum]|eukprot:gene11454-17619_t